MKEVQVFVATHKVAPKYGDSCYQQIHVGAKNASIFINGSVRDDDAECNISEKNDIYCELTGLYYVWKNISDVRYVGLCHYRRYPSVREGLFHKKRIMTENEIINTLQTFDIILPEKTKKNGTVNGYFPLGDKSIKEYRPYRLMLPVIRELCPDYEDDFEKEFHLDNMSFGNIMICSKEKLDAYCSWLFPILFMAEDNIVKSGDKIQPRELGYFSEWLLNIWVRHNKLKVKYAPLFLPEQPSLIKRISDKL